MHELTPKFHDLESFKNEISSSESESEYESSSDESSEQRSEATESVKEESPKVVNPLSDIEEEDEEERVRESPWIDKNGKKISKNLTQHVNKEQSSEVRKLHTSLAERN